MRRLLMTTCMMLGCGSALAEDAALLLGVERYSNLGRVVQAVDPTETGPALSRAGFKVLSAANMDKPEMRQLAKDFRDAAGTADRLVVSLSGRFATDGTRTWFMARNITPPQIYGVTDRSIAVETIMLLLSQAAGQAVLLLGEDAGDDRVYDGHLRAGIGSLDIPQGVTVIRGRSGAIADILADAIAVPGQDVMRQARRARGIRIEGYQPDSLVMTPAAITVDAAENKEDQAAQQESTAWDSALAQDSAQGFLAYLGTYPDGRFAGEARNRLAEIRDEPNRAARLEEEALGLSRDARRAIQRDLNVLDYDTRGIDGIFGSGTRRAVTNWQQQNGFAQTSYVTANQIARLDAQASRRAAELEAEAARKRAEEERRDRAYWEETGALADEAGFRAYLERYPDGLFAQQATARLGEIEEARRQQARAEDRAAWDRARERNNRNAYRAYLDQYPNGAFTDQARARIAGTDQSNADAANQKQAAERERQLGLDPIALRLIEAKLQQLGLEPGAVDGQFDGQSRRALRRYQRDRDLNRTGYLDQATVSRLLRDAFR